MASAEDVEMGRGSRILCWAQHCHKVLPHEARGDAQLEAGVRAERSGDGGSAENQGALAASQGHRGPGASRRRQALALWCQPMRPPWIPDSQGPEIMNLGM